MQGALDIAIQAAKLAGERILRGFHEVLRIEVKSDPVDRVTQVDRECQEIIVDTISSKYPDHQFIGEEEPNKPNKSNKPTWYIDPIDGTSNFIKRLPHCGVSIGLEVGGEPVVGVLHFPVLNEMYTGTKDGGAFRSSDSKIAEPIHVSSCENMNDAVVSEIYSDRTHRGKKVQFPPALAYRKFGSAITSLAYVADGRVDGTVLQCHRWDISAAAVIIREAGGRIEWRALTDDPIRGSIRCIASAPGIFDELAAFVALL